MIKYIPTLAIGLLGLCFGCDEQLILENDSPVVSDARLVVSECPNGNRTYIEVLLSDAESDLVDISIRAQEEPIGPFLYPGPLGHGLRGLTTSPSGIWHRIQWNECPSETSTCPIAIRLLDDGDVGCDCASPPGDPTEAADITIDVAHVDSFISTLTSSPIPVLTEAGSNCEMPETP